ncbi:ferulic acid esterase A faeA [Cordyceps fumosorosea ARSEF 2679]|uniref:Ferulic acid esterase A faeA n=1 Tax=Cordyceps fumosorosea (strain ARSEF 2679) TaxID=1081104 RepID=A0A167QP47_CORFA|nr:ferulic acid esterase A faeA [Cordyceps fumosorosea ARSEF 2679]OAA57818.1 ferulic acid esterase A faeA [Cordyceps fumosorosea ARSEF 2679]
MRWFLPASIGLLHAAVNAQTPVSSEVFDKTLRYAQFAAAVYQEDCPTPPFGSEIVKSVDDADTSTRAAIFRDDKAKEVIVAFRGTSSPRELDFDLAFTLVPLSVPGTTCPDCKVHQGFQECYTALMKPLATTLQGLLCEDGWRLVVTGHSLGGGISAIAAASFTGLGFQVSEVFTYGEPRNGNAAWARHASEVVPDDRYFRVTHSTDGIPQIPPAVLGYVHHSPEYFQSEEANNTAGSTWKCEIDSPKCNAGQDFGSSLVNNAHVSYSNTVVGSSLFVPACGAVWP